MTAEAGENGLSLLLMCLPLVIVTCLGLTMFLENLNLLKNMSSSLVCEQSHKVTLGSLVEQ